MVLKFKCPACGEYIITQFLKVGEVAKCRNCGTEVVVPENASGTDEEPKHTSSTVTEPEMVEKPKGKVRPFGYVLILSIVTLSIYFWVYLFKTLREMKNAFTFNAHETNLDKIRPILIAYLIVTILVAIIDEVLGWPFYNTPKTTGFYAWRVISTFISMTLFIAFWSSFVRLIELCQKKRGMIPLNKSIFWTLIPVIVVIYFASIYTSSLQHLILVLGLDLLAWLGLLLELVLFYLIVKQVNRVWSESGGVAVS